MAEEGYLTPLILTLAPPEEEFESVGREKGVFKREGGRKHLPQTRQRDSSQLSENRTLSRPSSPGPLPGDLVRSGCCCRVRLSAAPWKQHAGFPVLHYLLEFVQSSRPRGVGDAIQTSSSVARLSLPSIFSQHQ